MRSGCQHLDSSDSTVLASNVPSRLRAPLQGTSNNVVPEVISNLVEKWWQSYRKLVRRHRVSLELLDEGICRLVFWMPHSENGSQSTWREIVFGLLSINRLSMHCSQLSVLENSYATTVQIENPNIPATSIRIALSVIHCLMPSLLGMIQDDNSLALERKQTYLRFSLERLKFVLRICLLGSYWKQYVEQKGSDSIRSIPMGILLDGGMFYESQPQGLPEEEANNLERRRQYVGRRTGLQLAETIESTTPSSSSSSSSSSKTIVAELLYALRPLYWAYSEHQHHYAVDRENNGQPSLSLLKAWLTTITMDVVSLRLLLSSQRNNSRWSQGELDRRRMKLFLYLLRSPVWSHMTSPILSKSSDTIRKIPLLGSFIDACIWDWILYHKQAYVSEEG
jgi:hypothetical protein